MTALYLLRFDDICPTMNWPVWERVEEILLDCGAKPILAVVPDNQDPKLKVAEPHPKFWDCVRTWQDRGWTIGLHGFQHCYVTKDSGLMRINQYSEFSGLTKPEQQSKLQQALKVFGQERVQPAVWVAPAHSFDAATIDALLGLGIRHVSDGFSLYPYLDTDGMMWIPQQLWRFRKMPFGLWTVCLHFNRWTSADVSQFKSNLRKFASALTDWPSVISRYEQRKRSPVDSVFWTIFGGALRTRRWLGAINTSHRPG